jgi:23S rRNA pseudouridine955/2504/2580 synthase/23S rRNA pseudouridine1911/1915/1917 synthase
VKSAEIDKGRALAGSRLTGALSQAEVPKKRLICYAHGVKNTCDILYSDKYIVVVDKPAGMLSIPDRYDPAAPVVLSELEPEFGKLFVVHRIDKDTSGILLYARDAASHRTLSLQFASREVKKTYLAIVRGRTTEQEWECSLALLADADRQHRTVVDQKRGKDAFSAFETLERFRDYSYIRIKPHTGRTHQVRVHCAATGYPIAADPLYGDGKPLLLSQMKRRWKGDLFDERPLLARTALHAERIEFIHPGHKSLQVYESALPKDMAATLAQLRKISSPETEL